MLDAEREGLAQHRPLRLVDYNRGPTIRKPDRRKFPDAGLLGYSTWTPEEFTDGNSTQENTPIS